MQSEIIANPHEEHLPATGVGAIRDRSSQCVPYAIVGA
jgi:hypothetical protein